MPSYALRSLALLLFFLFLMACVSDPLPPAQAPLAQKPAQPAPALSEPASKPPQPGVLPPEPALPTLTLAVGEALQLGQIGTYCWEGVCADAIGLMVPAAALTTHPGQEGHLTLAAAPASGTLRVYTTGPALQQGAEGGWIAYQPDEQVLVSRVDLPPGQSWPLEMLAELPAGAYLVEVMLTWPGEDPTVLRGDATYGFSLTLN